MTVKLVFKGMLFAFSIFMLLLTMGYGSSGGTYYPEAPSHARYSGQAKIASPGARTSGFKSVRSTAPEPVVIEKSIFAKIREETERWMGIENGQMVSVSEPKRSELQKLQRRRSTQGVPGGMSVMMSR